jgi:hypothetical protein
MSVLLTLSLHFSQRPPNAVHSASFCPVRSGSSPDDARLTFLFTLHSNSTQSPSDTVHTMLFLMVVLTFLLAEAARCGALCESLPHPEWEQSG